MAKRDYYETLGLAREASEADLKSAFRKQAMRWHPDRNPGDAEAETRFKEVNEAYEILKDPQKRAAYDRYGHAAFEQGGAGGGPGFGSDFAFSMADIFENLFGDSVNRGRTRGVRERGADLRYDLQITLEEAFRGKTADLRLPTAIVCETCSGSGAKAGSQPKTCRTCQGLGRIRATQGFFSIERTCPTCQGQGETIDDPCPSCQGAGRVVRERALSVPIPAGVEEGTRIRLAGEGEAGLRAGPAGDLYIFISIAAHQFFQREGADLFCRLPISMTAAALGGSFEAPTIEGGRTRVKVPEATQNGKRLTLRNKGMPILRSTRRGDMHIDVVVETPRNLTKRQRELLEEFDKASSAETHPDSAGFFARVKDFFEGGGRRS